MASANKITTTGVLYINGAQVENTFTNISKITRKLESELKALPIGTQKWLDKANELKIARARFDDVRNEIAGVTSAVEKSTGVLGFFKNGLLGVGDIFKQVFTANLAERFLSTIVSKGGESVEQLLKVADAMTDVQKTSGMTLEQVKKLWDEFDDMDTRTNKLDRLKIAEVGGRLGVPIEEMKSFVQEVDKAYVALGDSFEGGLEGVVDQLGKIKGLFKETEGMTYAESINRVGSALNTLAAQGTASEGNISQFALRIGSLSDALKPAIDKVLGLGAAFEESGIDAQIASSGFGNFITTAAGNIEAFAVSMNMGVQEAKNLINTKPEEFFLRFAEGMKNIPADQTAKIFASLKLNSLEVQKAVGAAANRTDEFRKAMKTAGVEMEKMTSLQDEFNAKNNNAPAILEKIKNAWSDMFTTTDVINRFEGLIKLVGWLTGVTSDASNGMIVFKERMIFLWNILRVVVYTLLSYNAVVLISTLATGSLTKATWLNTIADKAQALGVALKNIVLLAYNVIMGLVTGNTLRARAAIIAFNTTTKMSPLGLLIALLVAVVVAYKAFSKEVDLAAKKQKLINDITAEANKGIISQKNELANLLKVAKDEAASKEARLAAIKKLNEISPEYLGNLTLENINTQKATDAVNAYTDALYRSSRARVLTKKLDEAVEKQEDQKAKSLKEIAGKDLLSKMTGGFLSLTPTEVQEMDNNMFVQMKKWQEKGGEKYAAEMMKAFGSYYEKRNQIIQQGNNDISFYQDELTELMKKDTAIITANNNPNIAAPEKSKSNREGKSAADKEAADRKKLLDQIEKDEDESHKKLLELKNDYQNAKSSLIDDEFLKEAQQEVDRRNQEEKKALQEIADLEKKKLETKSPIAKANIQKSIDAINEIEILNEETHRMKMLAIQQKLDAKLFEEYVKAEQRKLEESRRLDEDTINDISTMEEAKLALSKMQHLKLTDQEIRGIRTLEDAKRALREDADRKMLAASLISLEKKKVQLEKALKGLTGEAAEKLKADLDTLTAKITGLKGAINGGSEADAKKVQEEGDAAKDKVDVLGFSVKDWEDCYDNLGTTEGKVKAVGMAFQALANAGQMFSDLTRSLAEKDMRRFEQIQNKKKDSLLKQLNTGYLTQEDYNKQVQKLEVETANKKAEMEYKQAKADKMARMFAVIGNTAMGVASALAAPFPINTWLPWIVGAMGAVQLGIVASQPLPDRPSFDGGGFTGDGFGSADQSGFKPAGVVHENEWVAPKWMLESPRTAKVIDYLESVRMGKTKPMADGGLVETQSNPNNSPAEDGIESNTDSELLPVLYRLGNFLEYLITKGVFIEKNVKNGKAIDEMINDWKELKNKNKH